MELSLFSNRRQSGKAFKVCKFAMVEVAVSRALFRLLPLGEDFDIIVESKGVKAFLKVLKGKCQLKPLFLVILTTINL